ncbi:MAG: IS1634 family transposase [Candidatus Omnitrophica bacterium]|nr:IS1634 family transposase [Candidatus Omnitrophota bacterium]
MFVRIKTTPNSPRKSVQIVQSVRKADRVSQKIVRHVGIAHDEQELKQLMDLAESIKIKLEADNQYLLFGPEEIARMRTKDSKHEREEDYKVNLKNLKEEQRVVSGMHDIYGSLFDNLGYKSIIKNPARYKSCVKIFKDIVLARIANPQSKRASVDMLEEDFGISIDLNRVYQMMDKLDETAIDKLNDLAYENTVKLFQDKIDVIFFDCTTLYFETFEEDEFRKNGYSKDLKFNQPQVLFALMVTKEGLPIGYKAFEGSTYEGHTLIPIIKELRKKYTLDKVIFVADAGMLNEPNISELEAEKIEYVVGMRLKNLPRNLQNQIMDHSNYKAINGIENDEYKIGEFEHNGRRLIVNYSAKRARKDVRDRHKAVEKLRKKLLKKKNPKEYMSNYGNRKYLKVEGNVSIELNDEKIEQASRWDGLHGVVTNAENLSKQEILKQYNHLWEVENAFRITKHDLKVRPVFHWKPRRVKAHIAIAFVAYSLVKYLEYRVRLQYRKMSPEKIRQCLVRVQTSVLYDDTKRIRYGLPSRITQDARKIYKICNVIQKLTPFIIKKM